MLTPNAYPSETAVPFDKPYVHNPRLKRWLHRDARGALLWTSGTTRSVSDTANPGNIRP
jgi:hypothetical protein